MKVLLISANVTLSPYPVYPLGVSMVAAALKRAGHEVLQADFLMGNCSLDEIAGEVNRFSPDLVGISVRNIDSRMREASPVLRPAEPAAVENKPDGAYFSTPPSLRDRE